MTVHATSGIACPEAAMRNFLQIRPKFSGPLFCHFSGEPITRYKFSSVLNKTLDIYNIGHTNFKSHSFCIGAATTLARRGADQEKIQIAYIRSVLLLVMTMG